VPHNLPAPSHLSYPILTDIYIELLEKELFKYQKIYRCSWVKVNIMIYSGYESGHYFVRLTHDMPILDVVEVLRSGYRMVGRYMLLIKRREFFEREIEFELTGR
jgi:hypothetical protein